MEQEKILNLFNTVHILTVKVVGQTPQLEPIYEKSTIKLNAHEWPLWISKCALHGYKSIQVIDVLKNGQTVVNTELLKELQLQIDAILKPSIETKKDHESEIEALKAANDALLKRLEALENKNDDDKSERTELIEMAKELGLTFPKNIKTDALKSLIENSK